jgi:hypothetical protein
MTTLAAATCTNSAAYKARPPCRSFHHTTTSTKHIQDQDHTQFLTTSSLATSVRPPHHRSSLRITGV